MRRGRDSADGKLVKRLIKGDREALADLYRRHSRRLYNLCLRMVHDPDAAADLTQETFVRVFLKAAQFRGDATFTTWSYRIAVNLCLDHMRKEKRRDHVELVDRADPVQSTERSAMARIDYRRALEALDRLDPDFKSVVVLVDVHGLSLSETAQVLEIPMGTVKSRLHRGRAILVAALQSGRGSGKQNGAGDRHK